MRVRIVLGLALAAVAGALILDASGRAPRGAGSDHAASALFAANVPGGEIVCQPDAFLSDDAARVQIQIGTFGRPVPDLRVTFVDLAGTPVASGALPAGGREGLVTIPIKRTRRAPASTTACLHIGGSSPVELAGEAGPIIPGSEVVGGRQQPGRVSLTYFRAGEESWSSLLPELTRRFGLGKAAFFGDWTLPVAVLMLLGVWVAAARLLSGELT
ncbi:MAG TPA: hypothetical protein VGW98_05645 [Solirubrobacteraceae bacterium]|nr:hypothetical protein [Solirubrobacteraceae bacterium]